MPPGREYVIINGGVATVPVMVMLRGLVAYPAELSALTVKLNVPDAVGVPEITPPLESVKPLGKVPLSFDQVIGVVPLALSV